MKGQASEATAAGSTRERILLEAATLFAKRGYASVTVRDIARVVGLRPSSLYNYFASKEALFNAIVHEITQVYLGFYNQLEEQVRQAASFVQVLDCLFAELVTIQNDLIRYGVSLICTEQLRNETARKAHNDVLLQVGIGYAKEKFDDCVAKGWVKPFDTGALATLFMNSVLAGALVRTHQEMGHPVPYRAEQMLTMLHNSMLQQVAQEE